MSEEEEQQRWYPDAAATAGQRNARDWMRYWLSRPVLTAVAARAAVAAAYSSHVVSSSCYSRWADKLWRVSGERGAIEAPWRESTTAAAIPVLRACVCSVCFACVGDV